MSSGGVLVPVSIGGVLVPMSTGGVLVPFTSGVDEASGNGGVLLPDTGGVDDGEVSGVLLDDCAIASFARIFLSVASSIHVLPRQIVLVFTLSVMRLCFIEEISVAS